MVQYSFTRHYCLLDKDIWIWEMYYAEHLGDGWASHLKECWVALGGTGFKSLVIYVAK